MSLRSENKKIMYHSMYHKNEKKVPGIVVIVVLVLVIASLVYVLRDSSEKIVVTQDSTVIERIDIGNVRDTSATVYWRTKEPTEGYLVYGSDSVNLIQTVYDDRDTSAHQSKRHNHIVHIPAVSENSDIFFRVYVDQQSIGQSAEVPFTVKTARPLTSALDIDPIYGDIARSSGVKEHDAVVVLHIGSARPLLTTTNQDGTFLFAPCCLYNVQSGEPMYPSENESIRLEIIAEDGTSKILQAALADVSPLSKPVVIDSNEKLFVDTPSEPSEPEVLAVSDSVINLDPVDIIFPQENAAIPGTRPLVKGVGEPGESVKGTFPQEDRIFQVTVDEKRNWVYEPSFDFSPGNHELNIDTRGVSGEIVSLSRAFTILKSGEAVLGEATPSGTLTPTLTPTSEPTEIPIITSGPTVTPAPPVSGFNILPITLISLVLIVIGGGIILLF